MEKRESWNCERQGSETEEGRETDQAVLFVSVIRILMDVGRTVIVSIAMGECVDVLLDVRFDKAQCGMIINVQRDSTINCNVFLHIHRYYSVVPIDVYQDLYIQIDA